MFKKLSLLTLCALGLVKAQDLYLQNLLALQQAQIQNQLAQLQNLKVSPVGTSEEVQAAAVPVWIAATNMDGRAWDATRKFLDVAKNFEKYDKFITENRYEIAYTQGKLLPSVLSGMSLVVNDMDAFLQDAGSMAKQIIAKTKDGLEYLSYAEIQDGKPVSDDAKMLFDMAAENLQGILKTFASFHQKLTLRLTQIQTQYKEWWTNINTMLENTSIKLTADVESLEEVIKELRAKKHALLDKYGENCGVSSFRRMFGSTSECDKIDEELMPLKKKLAVAKAKKERFEGGLVKDLNFENTFGKDLSKLQLQMAEISGQFSGAKQKLEASQANVQSLRTAFMRIKDGAEKLQNDVARAESELRSTQTILGRARGNDPKPAKLIVPEIEPEAEYIPKIQKEEEPEEAQKEEKPLIKMPPKKDKTIFLI